MILRGLPKMSSGLTWMPSMTTANSASMPIAASWIRSRVDDLFSGPFFFFCCSAILTFYQVPSLISKYSCNRQSTFCVPRHRKHVAQIQVQVVLRVPGRSAVRTRPDPGQGLARDQAEALDRTPVVQEGVANPVDIG